LVNPPNDEELAEVMLQVRKGKGIGQDVWDVVTASLFVSPERRGQLRTSVEMSVRQMAKQADSLQGLRERLRGTREEILRKTLTTEDRGTDQFSVLLDAAANLAQEELVLKVRHAERLELRGRHLERIRKLEQQAAEGMVAGTHTKVDQLRATAARISAEIARHSERYPDNFPGRMEAHIERVEGLQVLYGGILAKALHSVPGGEQEKLAVAATSLAVARAELESARGNHAQALCYQRVAYVAARRGVDAAGAGHSAAVLPIDVVLNHHRRMIDVRRTLVAAERRYGDP
jgi:hypothetical protein